VRDHARFIAVGIAMMVFVGAAAGGYLRVEQHGVPMPTKILIAVSDFYGELFLCLIALMYSRVVVKRYSRPTAGSSWTSSS
jgi:type II secretory pathway component PulF